MAIYPLNFPVPEVFEGQPYLGAAHDARRITVVETRRI